MYAVIQAGARQFKVSEGEQLVIDRVPGQAGDKVKFDKVLFVGGATPKVGAPLVTGAQVEATIKQQTRGEKIIILKYRRRKNSKRRAGHRQPITILEINRIHS